MKKLYILTAITLIVLFAVVFVPETTGATEIGNTVSIGNIGDFGVCVSGSCP